MFASMKSDAWWRAISIRVVASIGLMSSSLKFVFQIQPANVVLLVIENTQSPLVKHPASISTHGLMIDAMNSSKWFEARKRNSSGSSYRQANPSSE